MTKEKKTDMNSKDTKPKLTKSLKKKNIVNKPKEVKTETNEEYKLKIYKTFESMNLDTNLLKGIHRYGYFEPSAIQMKGIMPVIEGEDVIIQAQSGSGKTATFSIGVLQNLELNDFGVKSKPKTQALIIAHTRELAFQIAGVFTSLSEDMNAKGTFCCGGGLPEENQLLTTQLKQGQEVILGTPGRILDMIKRGKIDLTNLKMLVLDEADQMFAEGFKEQIYNIYYLVPHAIQVIIVSATLPKSCMSLIDPMQCDPVKILVRHEKLAVEKMYQFYINVGKEEKKFSTLCDIYANNKVFQTMIFVNTKSGVQNLDRMMKAEGYSVSSVHGDLSREDRQQLMTDFRSQKTRVLICTDLYARGIDVHTVNMVVNYDVPLCHKNKKLINKEIYLHRVGRCARFKRRGAAVSLVTKDQIEPFMYMCKHYNITLKPAPKDLEMLPWETKT